jgi:uncharacterized protein YraI
MPKQSLIRLMITGLIVLAITVLTVLTIPTIARAQEPVTATALVGLNVRSGPGLQFEKVGILLAGQHVILDGRSGHWYHFGGFDLPGTGWISRGLVSVNGDPLSLPEINLPTQVVVLSPPPDDSIAFAPVPRGAVVATVFVDVIIRGGPGVQFEALGALFAGQSIVLDGRSGGWYRFSYPNSFVKGWLSADLVMITGNIRRLADVTFPPQ